MGDFERKLHRVKFNIPKDPSPEFFVEIDGKKIEGVCGLTIESRMASGLKYPRVTISFWAIEAKGEMEGEVMKEIFDESPTPSAGYQPIHGHLDNVDPPQGGSGVPPKTGGNEDGRRSAG